MRYAKDESETMAVARRRSRQTESMDDDYKQVEIEMLDTYEPDGLHCSESLIRYRHTDEPFDRIVWMNRLIESFGLLVAWTSLSLVLFVILLRRHEQLMFFVNLRYLFEMEAVNTSYIMVFVTFVPSPCAHAMIFNGLSFPSKDGKLP